MLIDFFMSMRLPGIVGAAGLLLALSQPARAQRSANNDGFQRRNGQMQVVRNGQPRPMAHDAHLPTGAVVTTDGFVVSPDGRRTELREGQGCDLRGRPVAVRTVAGGALALAPPAAPPRAAVVREAVPARSLLEEMFGERGSDDKQFFKLKKSKKRKGKGHGKGHGRWKDEGDD